MIDPKVVELGRNAQQSARLMEGLEIIATNNKIASFCGVFLALADSSRGLASDDLASDPDVQHKQLAAAALFARDWFKAEGIEL